MVVGHVRVECCLVGPDLDAEDPVLVLQVGGEGVGQAAAVAAGGRGDRPGRRDQFVATAGGGGGVADHDQQAQSSIRASCWLISRGLESPAIFCRNGVWSKTKSRTGRSGAGAWWKILPSIRAIWTCLAVCGLRGSS